LSNQPTNCLTNKLTPCSGVLEKSMVPQLAQKFPAF